MINQIKINITFYLIRTVPYLYLSVIKNRLKNKVF